jgi:hypothetical protein
VVTFAAMLQPPPPPKRESRQHPRYELYASVELRRGEDALVLPARNISLGGLYLAADGNRLNKIEVGETVDVVVFDAMDASMPTLRAAAQVVRNEGQGLALGWATTDPVLFNQVATILDRLAKR